MGKLILSSGSQIIRQAYLNTADLQVELIDPALANGILYALRKVFSRYNFIGRRIYFKALISSLASNKLQFDSIKDVVIFDSIFWEKNLDLIKEIFPNATIRFYFMNIVSNKTMLKEVIKFSDCISTFDKLDANRYNFNFLNFFHVGYNEKITKKLCTKYDFVFVGRNKGRLDVLEKIYSKLSEMNFSLYFYIVKDSDSDHSNIFELQTDNINYIDYMELSSHARCLIEINQKGQIGNTIRALEAVDLKKKLITNNKHMRSSPFYNENNILIINEEELDCEQIRCFMNSDTDFSAKYWKAYSFKNWYESIIGQ